MRLLLAALVLALGLAGEAAAMPAVNAVSVTTNADGSQTYSVTLQILAIMTALTLLPAVVLGMTAFTRIIIVLAILRQALGTAQTPSSQVLIGLALFMTFFVMTPVIDPIMERAVTPYLDEEIGFKEAVLRAQVPFREFMLAQTRQTDLRLFSDLAGTDGFADRAAIPFHVLVPSFVTSELKTAFQIGFLIFIPFSQFNSKITVRVRIII